MTDKEPTIEIEVLRDFWVKNPAEGEAAIRIRAGRVLPVPLNDATLNGIENGSIRRHKPEVVAAEAASKDAAKKAFVEKAVGKK
jgi:hypothetical protein